MVRALVRIPAGTQTVRAVEILLEEVLRPYRAEIEMLDEDPGRPRCPDCDEPVRRVLYTTEEVLECRECGSCYVRTRADTPWRFVRTLYPWRWSPQKT